MLVFKDIFQEITHLKQFIIAHLYSAEDLWLPVEWSNGC